MKRVDLMQKQHNIYFTAKELEFIKDNCEAATGRDPEDVESMKQLISLAIERAIDNIVYKSLPEDLQRIEELEKQVQAQTAILAKAKETNEKQTAELTEARDQLKACTEKITEQSTDNMDLRDTITLMEAELLNKTELKSNQMIVEVSEFQKWLIEKYKANQRITKDFNEVAKAKPGFVAEMDKPGAILINGFMAAAYYEKPLHRSVSKEVINAKYVDLQKKEAENV